jgi:pimeloyl-ACP methyl ester carboxylesterase
MASRLRRVAAAITGGAVPRVTSNDGTPIAFDKAGRGPALIIVGGALSDRTMNGDTTLVAALKDHFTVITYDRRGRGESGDVQPYAVDREIDDIAALIENAGGTARLFGVSSGAALALQAAAKLGPARVSKLALYEPPYGQPQGEFTRIKDNVNALVKTGQPGEAAAFFLTGIGTPPETVEGMKKSPAWEGISKIDFTLAYDYEVLGDGRIPEDVARAVAIPTLVMDGEKTMDFMHATAARLASLVRNGKRATLEGQTHQVKADVVGPVLIEFFESAEK